MELTGKGMGKALKKAASIGSKYAVLVGEDEVESGEYTIKDLSSGEQRRISLEELLSLCPSDKECDQSH